MKKRKRRRKILVVSVKDFGATGDGAADDTQAFELAKRSLASQIKMPPGTYVVDGKFTFDPRFEAVRR